MVVTVAVIWAAVCARQRSAQQHVINRRLELTNSVAPALCISRVENHWFGYIVYKPAPFDRHTKYPLLVGKVPLNNEGGGPDWASAMAHAGAYVAIAYRGFGGKLDWDAQVMGVYQCLTPDPTIDPGRTYLFSDNDNLDKLTKLLEESPKPWRRAMFFHGQNATNNTVLETRRSPKGFYDSGTNDPALNRALAQFVFFD